MATNHDEVTGASVFIHTQDMQITKSDIIDALLTLNDALSQTWIVDSGASFQITPIKECFTTFRASSHGHVYLGNNHACSIQGIGVMHIIANGLPQLKKAIGNRDVVFDEPSILKNDCASKCDHIRVKLKYDMNPWDAPRLVGNNIELVVIEIDIVGQQNDTPNGYMQLPTHAENKARNDVQQPINNEDVNY